MKNLIPVLFFLLFLCGCNSQQHNDGTDASHVFADSSAQANIPTAIDTSEAPIVTGVPKQSEDTTEMRSPDSEDKTPQHIPLTIVIDNLQSPDATVELGLYAPQNRFLDESDQYKVYRIKPEQGVFSAKIADLPYGEYAIAAYQDVDENGKINKNGIGIPKEPYGFSNNYKPKIRGPKFDECKFTYDKRSHSIHFSLIQ
jgi:uncharacterized protein (DUF2141 family)